MEKIDLRSDTVTKPTPAMRRAMANAEVGDDVYGEDPTVNALEELAAECLGKEAGLFVPSGTMSNQIAAMTHTTPGQEVICEAISHIFLYEAGGLARLGGLHVHILKGDRGLFSPEQLQEAIRGDNIHFPKTRLVTFENTHNRAGGRVFSPQDFAPHLALCREHGIPVHLDGARVFNAAVALGINASELVADFDSVSFCLSKGLGAPVGSVLVGTAAFIEEARRMRKILGGGMRQAGVLAACGLIGLKSMVDRLAEDHRLAAELGRGIAKLPAFQLEYPVDSNIVVAGYTGSFAIEALVQDMAEKGVLVNVFGPRAIRLVTHMDLQAGAIGKALAIMAKY